MCIPRLQLCPWPCEVWPGQTRLLIKLGKSSSVLTRLGICEGCHTFPALFLMPQLFPLLIWHIVLGTEYGVHATCEPSQAISNP